MSSPQRLPSALHLSRELLLASMAAEGAEPHQQQQSPPPHEKGAAAGLGLGAGALCLAGIRITFC